MFKDKRFELRHRRRHGVRRARPTGASTSSSSTRPIRRGRAPCCSPRSSTPRCKRCLNKGGVLVTQNGVPMFQPGRTDRDDRQARQPVQGRHLLPSPRSRPMSAASWRWGLPATTRRCGRLPERTIAARYRRPAGFPTKYWTPAVHQAAFALPRFIEELVARPRLEDASASSPAARRTAAARCRWRCCAPARPEAARARRGSSGRSCRSRTSAR